MGLLSSNMTVSTTKPEEKRLDGSVKTGVDQTKSRVKPTSKTKNCAQFKRQVPEPRYSLHKRLDWEPKQPQLVGKGISLGECQFNNNTLY